MHWFSARIYHYHNEGDITKPFEIALIHSLHYNCSTATEAGIFGISKKEFRLTYERGSNCVNVLTTHFGNFQYIYIYI